MIQYNPDTGEFTKNGKPTGTHDTKGYGLVSYDGKQWKAHRLAFVLMGEQLPDYVDHVNGDRSDNRWENLRPATMTENNRNAKMRRDNSTGVKGVTRDKNGKYRCQIQVNGKCKTLGRFDDLELAQLVVEEARSKYHGNFSNNGNNK